MTVLPAVYTPPPTVIGATPYRGVRLDVTAAMPWVEAAACRVMYRQYGDHRQRDRRYDARTLIESAEQWVTGYQGEAAFAMHYGLPIDTLLTDRMGKPDFEFRGRNVDVKTTKTHQADRIYVRADILGKDLSTWWIVAASSTVGSNDVALLGFLPARELTKYPTKAAAEGHDKPYIVIPADDFLAMPEKAT